MENKELQSILRVDDVAKILGISRVGAYNLVKTKGFPSIRITDRRIIVPRDAFLEWLNRRGKEGVE